MDIWFYHLTRQPLERTLPVLLERCLERSWKAVVQAQTEERVTALDEVLWTYSEESFLAHGTARDGDGELQHVYLTTGQENPNGAQVRFFIEGARIAPALDAPAGTYERMILMFDGNDPDDLTAARAQWKELKAKDCTLSYWQQNEAGGWEKKA
jgi:DNA polymerase-3 subunit chi